MQHRSVSEITVHVYAIVQDIDYSSVEQMLVFTVEMLGDEAHHILANLGSVMQLKETTYLR